jgi:hypothetical protein
MDKWVTYNYQTEAGAKMQSKETRYPKEAVGNPSIRSILPVDVGHGKAISLLPYSKWIGGKRWLAPLIKEAFEVNQ